MRAIIFLAFSSFGTIMAASAYGAEKEKFAVYYSNQAPIESFSSYQLLVFDRLHHPQLQPLHEQGKAILGYISVGEIESTSPYFSILKSKGLVLQENKNWKGSYYVDLRNPLWARIIIEEIIPKVLRDGFDGVFLDTLDNSIELERTNHVRNRGMSDAAVHIVEAVRMHYPSIQIMVNRAYPILPSIASNIDMVLGESVLGDYNFDKKTYGRVEPALYQQQVQWLQAAKQYNRKLKIYTLDYANTANASAVAEIYRIQRANGFIPYVASVGLDKVVEEPETERKGMFQ
jgi:uncharacterized protein (TIGR01370 family)